MRLRLRKWPGEHRARGTFPAVRKALSADPAPLLRDSLAPVWPRGGIATIRMPIGLRVARLRDPA